MSLSHEQEELLRQWAKEHNLLPPADASNAGDKRPQFKLPADDRELHDLARDIGEIAVITKQLFRRDRTPVVINTEMKRLDVMDAEEFRTWISEYAACYREKFVEIAGREVPVRKIRTMNLDCARGILSAPQFRSQLPKIDRLNETRLPVIRTDGTIDLLPVGYFEEKAIYTLDDGLTYDMSLTLGEARKILDDLMAHFPFANERSRAVFVVAMLTMFCATMLPPRSLRPGFIYTANSVGAGKTLGAKFAIIPVVGSAAPRPFPRKEEAKKVLDIIAMDAASYVLFDNVRGKIKGEEIESFITSDEWEGRILGESTKFRVRNVATVFLTGNQSTTSEDMADRCLFVELFVQEADHRDRQIPRVIDDSFLADSKQRSLILSCMWAFVHAWDVAGRPAPRSAMPRFEAWSKIVPAIASFAGYEDAVRRADIQGAGDEVNDMRTLVIALAPADDSEEPSAKHEFDDLIAKIKELDLFDDMEVRGGRRDSDLFEQDGKLTRAGLSLFGKLFMRFDRRLFAVGNRSLRFIVSGKGEARRFIVERER